VLENSGAGPLVVNDGFDRAWRRVGLALDRSGFTVEDRDRSKGVFFVRYIDPEVQAATSTSGEGWLDKLAFWRPTPKAPQPQFRVLVTESGSSTSQVVVQNAKGELLSADLEASSGDPELDAAALHDIRAAAATLPHPPARLVEGRDFVSSEWQFDLVVAVTPLAPVLTFEFDEALGSADAKVPLTRKVHKRVRLLAVP